MKLSPVQSQVSDDHNRFRVIVAGRRWGKSFLSMNEAAKFARVPHSTVMYVAPTYRQAREIFYTPMRKRLRELRWLERANESNLDLHLINGTTIRSRSADNHDSLRGSGINFLIADEFQDIDIRAWTETMRPMLSDTGGHGMFIGTPKGKGSAFYDMWVNAGVTDDWSAYQFTTLQGGNVPPAEIEAARRDLGEREFRQEYEASWESWSGVCFYEYDDAKHLTQCEWPFEERTPLFIGMDFNLDPCVAVISVKLGDQLHIIDEVQIHGTNTNEMCEEIRNRYGHHRQITVFPDATGKRTNTNSRGVSDHLILQNAGFNVITGKSNPNVNDSISAVNAVLHQDRIHIDPRCRHLRKSMLGYSFKEGTKIVNKDNVHDHMADALRYLVHNMFPVTGTGVGDRVVSKKKYRRV